jgi:DNA modification methylase
MAAKSNQMVVEVVGIDTLKPLTPTVRTHTKRQLEVLRAGLQRWGQIVPIPITSAGEIIDNECLWRAHKANGATHVSVVVVADKTAAEIQAIRLALNRTALDTIWDDEGLRQVFQEIQAADIDLDLTGFSPPEIDLRLNFDLPEKNAEENGGDIPPLDQVAISAPGTIWILGNHRIGCGSATDSAFVDRVVNKRLASACFIDPPYNVKIHGSASEKGKNRHREFAQGTGEFSPDDYVTFLCQAFRVLKPCCGPGALIYSCIDWRHVLEMNVAARMCSLDLYNICVWVKSNGGMGGIYRNAHELICVYRTDDQDVRDNVELGKHGRNRTNVWSYPGMSSFGKDRDALLGSRPTAKPIAMIADAVRDVTKRGELVLDTFLGSGSTLMAAQETGRVCYGVELDPLYVDLAVRRWQNVTGRAAVMISTGETFNAAAGRRPAALPRPNLAE